MFGKKKAKKKKPLTQAEIDAQLAAIKALGSAEQKKKRKKKDEDAGSYLYKLLNHLNDEAPECRIAACEMLGKTSSDVAWTHISHQLNSEKDEKVITAMRAALGAIRANMQSEHEARV